MSLDIFTSVALVKQDAGFATNSNITTAIVTPFVDSANGEVSSAIASRYSLPLSGNSSYANSPAKDMLARIATELGAGCLMLSQYEGMGGEMAEVAIAKINMARKQLRLIAEGGLRLIDSTGTTLGTQSITRTKTVGMPNSSTTYSASSKFCMTDTF